MTKVRGLVAVFGLLCSVGVFGMPGGAWGQALALPGLLRRGEGQVVPPSLTPRTFGTAHSSALVIGASELDPLLLTFPSSFYVQANGQALARELLSGAAMAAWVRLPAGAVVTDVELEGCDTHD